MNENRKKSDRQYAAYISRKFFSGKISLYQVIDSFPNYDNDSKIEQLYNRIINKPRKSWFFGVSKSNYEKYITETYNTINELES
jgi:hypothetical protein